MEGSIKKRYLVTLGILFIASVYMVSNTFLKPKLMTDSANTRFNQWVKFYDDKEGYTVEYYNFEEFKLESDLVVSKRPSDLAKMIDTDKVLVGFITVFFDWENDIIFYRGTGPDSTLLYCYYCNY
jgi:hypothetical protein